MTDVTNFNGFYFHDLSLHNCLVGKSLERAF